MTVVLDDEAVRSLLDPVSLVDEIESAIRAEAVTPSDVPERVNLSGAGRFLRVMPAVVPNSGVMGLKAFFGGGGVGVRYLVILASIETGEVLAAMDACYLTAARTAATSAVAARAMGLKASTLGILGSGLEAEAHARTFAALGHARSIKVFSPNPRSRERFAARMRDQCDVEFVVAESAEDACRDVEHLITATNTGYGGPIACETGWVPAGLHITAIGSTHLDLRELETGILRRADALVFDAAPEQVAAESGDVKQYLEEGGELGRVLQLDDVLRGQEPLPAEPRDLTIFKSVGTALQDLVAAELVYRRTTNADLDGASAGAVGLGLECADLAVPKTRR